MRPRYVQKPAALFAGRVKTAAIPEEHAFDVAAELDPELVEVLMRRPASAIPRYR